MAFDLRNDYFQKEFTGGDGNGYTITLICGHHQDAVTPNIVEFPDNVIFPEIEVTAGYENDVPVGLPMARTLSLKIDLANLKGGDWADVCTAIVRGYSTTQRVVNGVSMYIPNVWIVSTLSTTHNTIYACQVPSTKSIDISNDVATYTLDTIGIEKPVLERTTIEMLGLDSITPDWEISFNDDLLPVNQLVDVCYKDIDDDNNFRYLEQEPFDGKRLYKMSTLFGLMESKSQNVLDAFLRNIVSPAKTVTITTSDIDSIWTFYIQDVDTNHLKGTSLSFDDLLIFGFLVGSEGDNKGGFFDAKENGIYSYNNCWSFIRQFTDSMLMKGFFNTSEPLQLKFYPILDGITSTADLANIDPKEYKLNPSEKYISESTGYIVGAGQIDVGVYKQISDYGSIDGSSQDSEIMFNNLTLQFSEGMDAAFKSNNDEYTNQSAHIARQAHPSNRTLYYRSVSSVGGRYYFKVFDDCDLVIGGSNSTITGDTSYTSIKYDTYQPRLAINQFTNALWFSKLVKTIRDRQQYYGIGYNRCLASKIIFSNENQGIFETKLSTQITNNDSLYIFNLGESYTVDLATVSNIPSLGEFSGKLILVNMKYDYISGTIDCKFFMRGDAGA